MFDTDERYAFWVSVLVYTTLSGFGSLFIILDTLRKSSHRNNFNARLILYLATADFCLSFICLAFCAFNLHHGVVQENSLACIIQPVITWYFMEASILWLTTIAVHSALLIFINYSFSSRMEIIANCICWGLPIITTTIPLGTNTGEHYGDRSGLWCSFSASDKSAQAANILSYYIPCLVIIALCYIGIAYKAYTTYVSNEVTGNSKREVHGIVKRLFCYVFCYFLVWTPLVICYIYEQITLLFVAFWAEYISANLLHIQGIINLIVYYLLNKKGIFSCMDKQTETRTPTKLSEVSPPGSSTDLNCEMTLMSILSEQ